MTSRIAIWRWLPVALGLTLAGACGFHLRTWDLESAMDSAYVTSTMRSDLAEPLRRALRQAGVKQAETPAEADIVIELLDQRQQRRSASVSGTARVTEYEITYGVYYRVIDGDGDELVPAQWVERREVYSVDRNNIVGSSEEQSLLQREMREDIVQQILRTLTAVAPRAEAPPRADSAD